MKILIRILVGIIIIGAVVFFIYKKSQDRNSVLNEVIKKPLVNPDSGAIDNSMYTSIPHDEFFNKKDPIAKQILDELNTRYKNYFTRFVDSVKQAKAKLVICWLTSETWTPSDINGKGYISGLCSDLGVDFVDLSDIFRGKKAEEISFMPVDGHMNAYGAKLLADKLMKIVDKYSKYKSTVNYQESIRSKVFGDFDPDLDEVRDGGKNLPYRIKINSQGLRMDYNLSFPKMKQRVLLMGSSGFFFPFLDNPKTGTGLLQVKYPDKEILNAANWAYSIDDELSLWNERLKYAEPDLVLLQINGDDIIDLYFTHRLSFSRHKEKVKPTELEKKFYESFSKNQPNNK